MSSSASPDVPHGPLIEPDPEACYTLDVVANVCGLSSQTILHYHEQGLLGRAQVEIRGACFNDESVRRIRRIEHLRHDYGMDSAAIRLTLELMDELDRLRIELRLRQ